MTEGVAARNPRAVQSWVAGGDTDPGLAPYNDGFGEVDAVVSALEPTVHMVVVDVVAVDADSIDRDTYDTARRALAVLVAVERGDVDTVWQLLADASERDTLVLAVTAEAVRYARAALGISVHEFLGLERGYLVRLADDQSDP